MVVFDADGHIMEPEAMFTRLEPEFYPRRPVRASLPSDTYRGENDACWIFEGRALPSLSGRGPTTFYLPGDSRSRSMVVPVEAQSLEDIRLRLADLDHFGIDQQVVFPTLFLVSLAEDLRLEAALFRAYNDYVCAACAGSGGRLKWAALVSFRDPEAARAELRRVSDMGASAILTLGMVWDRSLHDPAFLPVFESAADLDLPLCVHFGWGSWTLTSLFEGTNTSFCSATTPVHWAFYWFMVSGLLSKVPTLRVGFLESGSGWVPYLIDQVRRRLDRPSILTRPSARTRAAGPRDPMDYVEEGRVFVACEHDEDLPYLVSRLGEGCLMAASDYPHGDTSADEAFVDLIRGRDGLSASAKEKLLGGNAQRFYRS
ncbi:MAG: amidohydrolase family protein [Chloroflexi bacterium]|nr:amidohydrolase family protein [Chloroflexota bacterium]